MASNGRAAAGRSVHPSGAAKGKAEPSAVCLSDVGRSRSHNEDKFGENPQLGLWVVADGVGGHDAGEVASELAVAHILRLAAGGMPVAEAVETTHDIIRRAPSEDIGKPGMATTVVVAQLNHRSYRVYWVGDSRAYVHGSDGLQRLTVDHSYVQQLVDSGAITAQEAEVHPERSVVTQCVGWDGHPAVEVDEVAGELYRGELLLLCTDGLTGEVDDADIAALLREETPLADRAQRLVDKANANGGSDNITVALIPAPADAPPKPEVARTRQVPSLATRHVPIVRKRRRTVRWTGAAAGVAVILTTAWFWRERIIELAPAFMSYLREAVSAVSTESAAPRDPSSFEVLQSGANSGEATGSWGEDSAQDDLLGDEQVSPLKSDSRGDAPRAAEDPGSQSALTSQPRDWEETHAAIGDQGP